ncbi:MAG: hypothetical protein NT154_29710, partial [Verrucomicrobia bacterium]|nr:hypothetical protein [Verrucomicrobiota bacterium]
MKSELPTATGRKRGFWRTCRLYFRRFRISVWLLILALVSALVYLTQIGLPDFAKKPLLENLRARGLDLQFSRLRLNWYRGIVADHVHFGQADDPLSPRLTAELVQVRLNHEALARLQIQVDGVVLRRGRLVWSLAETNQAPRQLSLEDIQAELRFPPGDEWSLDHFTAGFAGAKIQLSGTVTNASAVREWKLLKPKQAAPPGAWRDRLRQFADLLERIRFSAPPQLKLDVRGDARDLASFAVRMRLNAPAADTPWGTLSQGRFSTRLYPATTNGFSSAEVSLEAAAARTRWATTSNLQFTAHLASFENFTNLGNGDLTLNAGHIETEWGKATHVRLTVNGTLTEGQTNLVHANLALSAGQAESKWGSATNVQLNAQWIHALTNAVPLSGEGTLVCDHVTTEWGNASELQLKLRVTPPGATARPRSVDESWAWWSKLEPYDLDWDGRLSGVQSRGLEAAEIACGGNWRAPALAITNLHVELYQRHLDAHGNLNVATRALDLSLASDLDPHRVAPALSEDARIWLTSIAWEQPPELAGKLSLVLPAWTNRPAEWHAEVASTLRLEAELKIPHGVAYRGVPITAAQSHVLYSNQVWRLPDLTLARPEGILEAAVEGDGRTKAFYCRVSSTLNVMDLRPLLDPGQQRVMDLFSFAAPPVIGFELWGSGQDLERIGVKGRIALIYLTNGFSTLEPMVVGRAIGTNIAHIIAPYQFKQPPVAHVHGTIPMHGEEDADLHFDLDGGPFEWWRFHVPRVVGHVHWLGRQVTLSNIWLDFYGGQAAGSAHFDFSPRDLTDYQFALATTNALLQPLVKDLFFVTNHLEGRLRGTLVITNANTLSLQTWGGYGDMALRDGLIWEIPVFGIFSDVLNSMVPGLGSSRASAGTCTFGITNGLIRSDDMDI